jgi:lipoprotein signal peptidase
MPERSYRVLLWSLALTGLLLDQASKYGVFAWLYSVPGHAVTVFRGDDQGKGFHLVAQFVTNPADASVALDGRGRPIPHVNHGALFGFLRDHKNAANAGFAVISLLAALAILFWSTQKSTAADPWLCAALGLILAGTLGNFYDRMVFNGVRDFLHWDYLFDWPVFNFADCCLVCGAGLLLIQAFAGHSRPAAEPEASAEQAAVMPSPGPVPVSCSVPSVPKA